jgi:energy-converting hydrogenase A subunit M
MECNQFQSLFAKNRRFSSLKNSSELHESAEQSRTLTISIDITEQDLSTCPGQMNHKT